MAKQITTTTTRLIKGTYDVWEGNQRHKGKEGFGAWVDKREWIKSEYLKDSTIDCIDRICKELLEDYGLRKSRQSIISLLATYYKIYKNPNARKRPKPDDELKISKRGLSTLIQQRTGLRMNKLHEAGLQDLRKLNRWLDQEGYKSKEQKFDG